MSALDAESFGPVPIVVDSRRVHDFVTATGDAEARWIHHAPPGFGAVALIAVATDLLDRATQDHAAVVHTRQRFDWHAPLAVGTTLEVTGTVVSTRKRAGTTMVEFAVSAPGWMTSTSHFLLAADAVVGADEHPEPLPHTRAETQVPTAQPAPGDGEALPPLAKSASRLDLVRYAAASGDWNPIHWDHGTAVAAGLGGVIAHGLLSASWMAQAAARFSTRPDPLASIDLRFRSPLRPAAAATVGGSVAGVAPLLLDQMLTVDGEPVVTAKAEVNE